jgi:hypothetical protein
MAARFRHKQPKQILRSVSKTYLVVCEGQTEEFYLKGFKNILSREKQRTLKIEPIKAQSPDCLKVVMEAIERKKDAIREGVAYEEVWAFFDDDNQPHLQKAFEVAKKNEIRVAYSSISIEFWFLLHFEYSARSFMKGDEVTDALRKKGWPEYCKPAFDSWAKLQDKVPIAVQHALRLRKERVESKELAIHNPFTNIDLFLKSLGLTF